MDANEVIPTSIVRRLFARMQRTHDRRRASFFVGPAGIGKSTAVDAFRRANPGEVIVARVMKRGLTGPQALQQLLEVLRADAGEIAMARSAMNGVQFRVHAELERRTGGLTRDAAPASFPKLTIVFDEAQRLSNGAIDALRDYNEPHGACRGPFPLGLVFVGNNELSLQAANGGASLIDEGMADRLLYRERLMYDDVERADLETFARALGVTDEGAIGAITAAFSGPRAQRSFRRLTDFVDELHDEADGEPITRDTVRSLLTLTA